MNNIELERPQEVPHTVQILTIDSENGIKGPTVRDNVPVRELRRMDHLLKEIHHYGETGPTAKKSTVYYRFGDWVLGMNTADFYVHVEGIIETSRNKANLYEIRNRWRSFYSGDSKLGKMPGHYAAMQPNTGKSFFEDVNNWITGQNKNIEINSENVLESAYHAQCGTAMFLSESIRSFQNHVTNMMGLDLARHGYLTNKFFFDSHPMGRGGTWQVRDSNGFKKTGIEMLRDHDGLNGKIKGRGNQKVFDSIISRMSCIGKSWLSHVDTSKLKAVRNPPSDITAEVYTTAHASILSPVEDIVIKPENRFLRKYELREATERLLATKITEPEMESVDRQIVEFSTTEDISTPLRSSLALANDHVYVSDLINEQLLLKERQTGKQYDVIPNSVDVEENTDLVRFRVREKINPSIESEEISTSVDKTKLASKALVDKLQTKANELQRPSKSMSTVSKVNQGLAIYNVVRGLAGSISAFENGNITYGAIGLAQSLHGIGEMSGFYKLVGERTGFNLRVKAAGKYLGGVLRNGVENVGETISVIAGEDAGRLVKSAGGKILSTVGEVGEILEDVPIIGTAFGFYNVYEDTLLLVTLTLAWTI